MIDCTGIWGQVLGFILLCSSSRSWAVHDSLSCVERPQSSGSAAGLRGCTWSTTVFGWLIWCQLSAYVPNLTNYRHWLAQTMKKKKRFWIPFREFWHQNHLKTPLRREATSYLTHRLKSLPSSYSASLDCPISNLAWMLTRCTKHTYGKQHTWCVFMQWSPVTRESNQKLVTPLNHGCVPEPNTLTMVSATLVKQLTGWNPQGYCR